MYCRRRHPQGAYNSGNLEILGNLLILGNSGKTQEYLLMQNDVTTNGDCVTV